MLIDFHLGIVMFSSVIWIIICLYFIKVKKKSLTYILFFSVFYIYILQVINLTQFPIIIHDENNASSVTEAISNNVYLIPFQGGFNLSYFMSTPVLLNILMTIPFGFGVNFIAKTSLGKIIFMGVCLGVMIELLQFIVLIVNLFHLRLVMIDDVIFNFIGVMIGYFVFKVFARAYIQIVDRNNIDLNSITQYIYDVSKSHS